MALEAGACLPENFHLATPLCTPALTHLEQHPCHQRPNGREGQTPAAVLGGPRGAHPVQGGMGAQPRYWQRACRRHSWGPLGCLTIPTVCELRKCFQAGSDSHTRWDTPPGSGTTPSCGWCVPRARRSGRNWTIPELPRGRWRTGT